MMKTKLAEQIFAKLLPQILKEALDLIVTLPPQKDVPNIPGNNFFFFFLRNLMQHTDLFLQMVINNLQKLLENSPFFILSKLIGRAKDLISATTTSSRTNQYTSIVFTSIRDRILNAIVTPSDVLKDVKWLEDVIGLVNPSGKAVGDVVRAIMAHFDLTGILSIVTQELLRSLMFPHQLVMSGNYNNSVGTKTNFFL